MLKLENISFAYGKKTVLDRVSLSLEKGEILALMGPSGCGKTTLLNLIAGLSKPQGGTVTVSAGSCSYVFQEPRLFPWLTVKENLLAVTASDKADDEKISDILKLVELQGAEQQYPHELSGGMKIRASLARAMIADTELWLLDEPFSALDEELRKRLLKKLRAHIKHAEISVIFVTHLMEDALAFADRIVEL